MDTSLVKNALHTYETSAHEDEIRARRELLALLTKGPPLLCAEGIDELLRQHWRLTQETNALREQNGALQSENEALRAPPHTVGIVLDPKYTNGGSPPAALVVPLQGGRALTYPAGEFNGRLERGSEVVIANGAIIEVVRRHRGFRVAKVSWCPPQASEVWIKSPGSDDHDVYQPSSWLPSDIKPGTLVYVDPDTRMVTDFADGLNDQVRERGRSIIEQLPAHLTWNQLITPESTTGEIEEVWGDICHAISAGEPLNLGIIAEGAPGVGKTQFARTLAVELARVTGEDQVSFEFVTITAVLSKFFSESERNVAAPFQRARENAAQGRYSVIFIDEIDSLLQPRDLAPNLFPSQITSAILSELDSFESIDRCVLITATNRIDWIERAALRPGRMAKVISFKRPLRRETKRLLELYLGLAGIPTEHPVEELAERVTDALWANTDADPLATIVFRDGSRKVVRRTSQLTGALIADACKDAKRAARRRSREGGCGDLTYEDLMHAMARLFGSIAAAMQPHNLAQYLEDEPAEQLAGAIRVERPSVRG